jgi:hypothetical protein
MSITTANINTGGAVVTIGGTVSTADGDGYYIGTSGGTDVGCTTGGVTVTYTFETSDIFCDQVLAPVDIAITSETATIEFEMLESDAGNLALGIQQCVSSNDGSANKIGVGGITSMTFVPLQLTVNDNDTALVTTWTFFKCTSGGIATNFERDNPTTVKVTFTAYADTTHASGHQLFSVNEAVSV